MLQFHHLGYALSSLTRSWNQRFMEILRQEGYYNLKPSFCVIFFPLFENDGQSAAELARTARITKQTMSIYVRELSHRGYIKLVEDAHDKRIQRIFLTAKGSLLQKVFHKATKKLLQEIFHSLSNSEITQLSTILKKCSQ